MCNDYPICDIDLYKRIKPHIKYQYKNMVVFTNSKRSEFIVWNTSKPFDDKEKGHGHLKSLQMAKTVSVNIANIRIPKQRSYYILMCHIRCATDEKYIKKIEELIEVRRQKGKTLSYRNNLNFT